MFRIVKLYIKYWISLYSVNKRYDSVVFDRSVYFDKQTTFGGYNQLFNRVNVAGSHIGRGTYIAHDTSLPSCIIGSFCSIGPKISIVRGQHPTHVFVSTHPAFFSTMKEKQAGFTFADRSYFKDYKYADEKSRMLVSIGNDVWIGSNVLIIEGITIGDGAIVGAGSLVTKDLEPYGIYGGVPAKLIKKRFTEEQIKELLAIKWWEKDFEWIKSNFIMFHDIDKFIKEIHNDD